MTDVTTDSPRFGLDWAPWAGDHDGKNISEKVRNALLGVATQLGRDIRITSGYRSPFHWAERRKSRPGEHSRGRAVDISTAGMSDAEKRQLVEQLAQRGFNYFGTYSGRTKHTIHADMRPPAGYFNYGKPGFPGQKHFTHDRSQKNLSKAPAWFQEIAKTGGMDLPKTNVVPTPRPDPTAPEPKSALASQPARIPFPTGQGVSISDYIINALAANTEPEFTGQFAPGGTGLLGADPIAPQTPLEYFGPPAPRSDYPIGPTDPEPWQSSFAPAPAYPPRTASREHFEKTFVRPDPHAPMVQSGMSNRARATRDLADGMAQAGIAGLDGRPVAPAQVDGEGVGLGSVEAGASPASRTYDPGTRNRIPVPRARPTPSTIPVPTPAPGRGAGLVPTRGAIAPLGPYASGPKQQIFDFVLGKLLNPGRPAN